MSWLIAASVIGCEALDVSQGLHGLQNPDVVTLSPEGIVVVSSDRGWHATVDVIQESIEGEADWSFVAAGQLRHRRLAETYIPDCLVGSNGMVMEVAAAIMLIQGMAADLEATELTYNERFESLSN